MANESSVVGPYRSFKHDTASIQLTNNSYSNKTLNLNYLCGDLGYYNDLYKVDSTDANHTIATTAKLYNNDVNIFPNEGQMVLFNTHTITEANYDSFLSSVVHTFTNYPWDSSDAWSFKWANWLISSIISVAYTKGSTTLYLKTEKSIWANALVIYNLAPTVSYRQNALGINVDLDAATTDEVLVINETNSKKIITLRGVTNLGARDATLDLSTGELNNFVLDGGTWDV